MRAGPLDALIIIQQATITMSPSGERIETWVSLPRRWAKVEPVTASERYASATLVAEAQMSFTIRWSKAVDGVKAVDRIIFPASTVDDSPVNYANRVYNIIGVLPVGRYDGLKLIATVRQDEGI